LLTKREVFTSTVSNPPSLFHVGYKCVFDRKQNKNNKVLRYESNITSTRFTASRGHKVLISMKPILQLLMESPFTKSYIYEVDRCSISLLIWVTCGIPILNPNANRSIYCVKLQKSVYVLKQSGQMWYNQLSEFLL
jgi:hypothetical protein